jgi:hypothetical protein
MEWSGMVCERRREERGRGRVHSHVKVCDVREERGRGRVLSHVKVCDVRE